MKKEQNAVDTRKTARKWDPYFKKSNVKKLKNLLNNALAQGLTEVTMTNDKTGEKKIITVFELEQLINAKKQEDFVKHMFDSSKPEDFIPWYKEDDITLSLEYKDLDNIKYVDEATLNTKDYQREYIFDTDPTLKNYSSFTYTHHAVDKNKDIQELDYQIKFQKYPSNKVFVNKSGEIDVFSYNLSYLFIGERKHNAQNNTNIDSFVPFVTNYTVKNNKASYYTISELYKNSFISKINDVNNMTGCSYDNINTYTLSYIYENNSYLTLSERKLNDGELWGLESNLQNGLYFVPKYSNNYSANAGNVKNTEIRTAYSQIALMFDGLQPETHNIQIAPYISGEKWYALDKTKTQNDTYKETRKKYKKILEYGYLLSGNVCVYTHPIACGLTAYTTNERTGNIEYTYLSKNINVDISYKNPTTYYIKYSYTIDNSDEQIYDFSNKKYTYNFVSGSKTQTIDLCDYRVTYTLKKNDVEIDSKVFNNSPIISFKTDQLFCDTYQLYTKSSLKNPVTGTQIHANPFIINFTLNPKSNPSLDIDNVTLSATVDKTTQSNLSLNVGFSYNINSVINNAYGLNNVYMFSETNNEYSYNNTISITGCTLTYSYKYSNSGIVDKIYGNKKYELTYDVSQHYSNSYLPMTVLYTYNISKDNVQITKPELHVASEPIFNKIRIVNKTLYYLDSDDFDVWCDAYHPINTTEDTTYLVRNSYICFDENLNGTINVYYKHKSEPNSNKKTKVIDTSFETSSNVVQKITYSIPYSNDDLNISTYWVYDYNDKSYNNLHIFEYNNIGLQSNGSSPVTFSTGRNTMSTTKFISKVIPNIIFETLYNKIDVDNANEGFCEYDGYVAYPLDDTQETHQPIQATYWLNPVYGDPVVNCINLETLNNLILIGGQNYPLQVEYYMIQLDGDYYLYCVFTSPISNQQILPPFIYHLNIYDPAYLQLSIKDYEVHNNEKINFVYPVNTYSAYTLYGFSKEIFNNIDTVTNFKQSAFYNSSYNDGKPKRSFYVGTDSIRCCHVNCNFKFDENKKLIDFKTSTDSEKYAYVTKYTGLLNITNVNDYIKDLQAIKYNGNQYYIDNDNCIRCDACRSAECPASCISKSEDGYYYIDPEACLSCGLCASACPQNSKDIKFDFTQNINTTQKIKNSEVTAYLTTSFTYNSNIVKPTFRINNANIKGTYVFTETAYTWYPGLINNYPHIEYPDISKYPYVEDNLGKIHEINENNNTEE